MADDRGDLVEFPAEATEADWQFGYREHELPEWVRPPWKPGEPFAMGEVHAAFMQSEAFQRFLIGGFGSGKTHVLVAETLNLAAENPGCMGAVVEPTYVLAREVFQPAWESWLEQNGMQQGVDWTLNENRFTYQLWGGWKDGGSTVIVKTGEKPRRIVGGNLAWGAIDEIAMQSPLVHSNLLARIRDPKATRRALIAVGTPDIASWLKSLHDAPPKDSAWFRAETWDNPWLDQAYIDRLLENLDPRAADAYLRGHFVTLSGSAYYAFVHDVWPKGNIRAWRYDPSRHVYVTCDNNPSPTCVGLLQPDVRLLQRFDEITLRGATWGQVADAIHHKLGGVAPTAFVLAGDPSVKWVVKSESGDRGGFDILARELRRAFATDVRIGFKVPNDHPVVQARLSSFNTALCNVRGERRYVVDPRCKQAIADFQQVELDDERGIRKPGRGSKVDAMRTHHSDADGYLVHMLMPSDGARRLKPQMVAAPLPRR